MILYISHSRQPLIRLFLSAQSKAKKALPFPSKTSKKPPHSPFKASFKKGVNSRFIDVHGHGRQNALLRDGAIEDLEHGDGAGRADELGHGGITVRIAVAV